MRYVMHLGLTAMVAWWAIILAWPVATFPTSRSYAEFARICPDERYWACGFTVAATIGICGCWASWPARTPTRQRSIVRASSALLLGLNHGIIALLMVRANPASTGTGIYVLIMLMAYLLAISEAERLE